MKYFTPAEVASQLGVCKVTILRRIRSGEIRAVRLGPRTLKISEADLAEYLTQNKTAAK